MNISRFESVALRLKPTKPTICGLFLSCLDFANCQFKVVSEVISGMAVQDVNVDVCANLGDSRLKPPKASFSAVFERR